MTQSEKILVSRFATQRLKEGGRSQRHLLSYWRDTPAYVLLGDPGAGKTTAMTNEALACGAQVVSASEFGNIGSASPNKGTPVFIDGLDESRARLTDASAIDAIQMQLHKLKSPRFRLACREIDWLGGVDTGALKAVSPNKQVVELDLEPLTDEDIVALLVNWPNELPDPAAFWKYATERGLQDWIRNPMALELFVKAMARIENGRLPDSKLEIFSLACEELATEFNQEHVAAQRREHPLIGDILDDAGKMFATLLLSNCEALASTSNARGGSARVIALNNKVKTDLGLKDEFIARASLLFSTANGQSKPYHRTIAEYLGAKAIGRLVSGGLPIRRVLAMMSGQDGGIVEPLRGLHAWMAVTCPQARTQLIDRDPLGVVMYGDVRAFSQNEKLQIFKALAKEAERYAWFRNGAWNAHPFGALGTRDMVGAMEEILTNSERSLAHQSLLDCVIDAIRYGDDLPEMLPYLEQVMRDATFTTGIRPVALKAWLAQVKLNLAPAREWLDDVKEGRIDDPDDSIRGALLKSLYPAYLTPTDALNYFYQTNREYSIGGYGYFWSFHLLAQTPPNMFGELADAFVALPLDRKRLGDDFELPDILGRVIVAALRKSGHESPIRRVVGWLRLGRSEHWGVAIKGDAADEIGEWLGRDVETLKKVYAELCLNVQTEVTGENYDLRGQVAFLYGATLPSDWYNWLLTLAETSKSLEFGQFCLQSAARVVLNGLVDFDIRMEDVEAWVARNLQTWPEAENWLTAAWSLPIDHFEAKYFRQNQEHKIERLKKQEMRHQSYAEHFANSGDGLISAGLLYRLALAYKNRLSGIEGDSPHDRLQNLVGGAKAGFDAALGHLKASLTRSDLPTIDEILKSGLESKEHFVRPACLVAADIAFSEDLGVVQTWNDDLFKRLVAFWLTDGTCDEPDWYAAAVRLKPQLVAEVMVPFAIQTLRKRPASTVTGLWALARKDDLADFARAVVPAVLEKFPVRANEKQLSRLVEELLPGALKHLEHKQLADIAAKKLANTSMDAGQRIAWLALDVFQNHRASAKALVKFLGKSQSRAHHLIHALVSHADRDMNHLVLGLETQSFLIEVLGPNISPAFPNGDGFVRPVDEARDLIRNMIAAVSSTTEQLASRELVRLRSLPALNAWFTTIDGAIHDNTRLVRAASFVPASPQAVALTLANQAPASAADLQALVVDQLKNLEQKIRGSNNNTLDQFWTDKSAGVSQNSQIENVCRDRLKQLLEDKLQSLNVQLDKESYAADDKRMDLRAAISVDGKRRMLPIEIKKDSHTNVWIAWRDQLDKQYLNEPDADGYGVYLVLWFGSNPKNLEGVKPKNALEMKEMLSNLIPSADRTRIAVVLMDFSQREEAVKKSAAKKVAASIVLSRSSEAT